MSIINCKECNKEISSKAKQCPNCGAKPDSSLSRILAIFVIVLFLFFGLKDLYNYSSYKTPEPDKSPPAYIASTPKLVKPKYLHGEGDQLCLSAGKFIKGKDKSKSDEVVAFMLDHYLLSPDDIKMIHHKQVRIGSSDCLAFASWGKPSDINTTINQYSTRRQLVYQDARSYIYTENGIIKSLQN